MWRSIRLVALAGAALTLGAAQPKETTPQPNGTTQNEVSAPLQNIAAALQDANKPSQHDKPCDDGRDDRSSDLCAQWKAADAAKSSANATWLFGYVGTLIGLLTLAAAGAAAWYARKAAIHTEESAKATERMAFDAPIGIQAAVEGNNAAREGNEIAERAQRAWVRLWVEPQLVRSMGRDGLYIRINFVAENIGHSRATDFRLIHQIIFTEETESDRHEEMLAQVEAWRAAYKVHPGSSLLPSDRAVHAAWEGFTAKQVKWTQLIGSKVAYPLLLAAVFYRTEQDPSTLQVSWSSWFLHSINAEGHVDSWIMKPTNDLGPKQLCAEPHHLVLIHQEYAAPEQQEAQG